MKITQLFQTKKRRLILAAAVLLVLWCAVGAFAHGGREDGRFGGWQGRAGYGYANTERAEHAGWGFRPEAALFAGGAQGGYISPLAAVSEAQTLANKTPVRLRGTIDKALKNGRYEFHDGTGDITVEVIPQAWNGVSVSAGDTVEITGWIRKPFSQRSVLVTQIQKVQPDSAE